MGSVARALRAAARSVAPPGPPARARALQEIELYCFEPGVGLAEHRHEPTEHVLTVVAGEASVRIGERAVTLRPGGSVLGPAGVYHGIDNAGTGRLIVQQVSPPKPWDARFAGPHPSDLA